MQSCHPFLLILEVDLDLVSLGHHKDSYRMKPVSCPKLSFFGRSSFWPGVHYVVYLGSDVPKVMAQDQSFPNTCAALGQGFYLSRQK